jgi:uncharacterized membrane protein YfcA
LPVAVYGGFFGAGMGFIMLAFLGFTSIHDLHKMNAMKNVGACVVGIVSLACLLNSHHIDWTHGLFMAAGCIIGGYCGSRLAQKISSHTIHLVVIVIGLCAAVYLGFRDYT